MPCRFPTWLQRWGLGRGQVLSVHWDWVPGHEFSRDTSTFTKVIWRHKIHDGLSHFSWQLWKRRLSDGLGLYRWPLWNPLCILHLQQYTWFLGPIMLMVLIFLPYFPDKDFPWSWFHYNFKNTICLCKRFSSVFWTDFIWFLSCGSVELLQAQRGAAL